MTVPSLTVFCRFFPVFEIMSAPSVSSAELGILMHTVVCIILLNLVLLFKILRESWYAKVLNITNVEF